MNHYFDEVTLRSPSPACGSLWRQWDLHLHTPNSIIQNYGGEGGWDAFLEALEKLPDGYVVGANDYLFTSGIERVQAERASGRLSNLAAVFPVLEFRSRELVGGEKAKRLNFHVIFDPAVTAADINASFLHALQVKCDLASGETWTGNCTPELLAQLGRRYKKSIPTEEAAKHGSDLEVGFNSFSVPLEKLVETLEGSALRGAFLLGIGRAEWNKMKWDGQAGALKRHLVTNVDLLFSASPDAHHITDAAGQLAAQGLNSRVIHCSDAHQIGTPGSAQSIGTSLTWINSDPTLTGLRHALIEYETRVHTGTRPPAKLTSVGERPEHHLSNINIQPLADTQPTLAIRADVPLNPGFVAIIGNKGQGKSALLDVAAATAGTDQAEHFSFLTRERFGFGRPAPSSLHASRVTFANGDSVDLEQLQQSSGTGSTDTRLTYLPQRRIEHICSNDPESISSKRFTTEVERVVFAHIQPTERLGTTSLDALRTKRSSSVRERRTRLRAALHDLNEKVRLIHPRLVEDARRALERELADAEERIRQHESTRPPHEEQTDSQTDGLVADLEANDAKVAALEQQASATRDRLIEIATSRNNLTQAQGRISTFTLEYERLVQAIEPSLSSAQLEASDILQLTVDPQPIENAIRQLDQAHDEEASQLNRPDKVDSLGSQLAAAKERRAQLQDQIQSRDEVAAERHVQSQEWEATHLRLLTGVEAPRGRDVIKRELDQLSELPASYADLKAERLNLVREIHQSLLDELSILQDLYQPATAAVETNSIVERANLSFGANITISDLTGRFFDLYRVDRSGPFQGLESSLKTLENLASGRDWNATDAVTSFLEELDGLLTGEALAERLDPSTFMKAGRSVTGLYDLLFGLEFLEPSYTLRQGSTDLEQLSPGQKGTLLLIFYLLLDPSQQPILLDQPDENLDNQTIKDLLVPAIKQAAVQRQVLVVTHNANVAVVADADQIILASRVADEIGYEAGSIDSGATNGHLLDVLEGTLPAYLNRGKKYHSVP